MKHLKTAVLAISIFVAPLCAQADQVYGPVGAANPAAMQIMEQAHARMVQLHSQARASMLNALTVAHRNLLAQVVGQLAIAPTPDAAAAARVLDNNLSSAEAKSILNISSATEQQVRQLMDATHKQMQAVMPSSGEAHGPWAAGMPPHPLGVNPSLANDPGMILLMTSMHGSGLEGFHHFFAPAPGVSR